MSPIKVRNFTPTSILTHGNDGRTMGVFTGEEDVSEYERMVAAFNPGDSSDAHSETWYRYRDHSTVSQAARARG